MAEMYKNTKTGVKATFVEWSKDGNMVTLQKEDGKFTAPTKSSFEKYWVKIGDDGKPIKKEAVKEEKKPVEKPKTEPVKEKKAEKVEKPKAEKAEKPKKEKKPEVPKFDATAFFDRARKVVEEAGFTTNTYRGMDNFLCIFEDAEKKSKVYEMNFTKLHFRVYTNQLRVPKDVEFKAMKNALNAGITFDYDEKNFEKTIKTIIGWTMREE